MAERDRGREADQEEKGERERKRRGRKGEREGKDYLFMDITYESGFAETIFNQMPPVVIRFLRIALRKHQAIF